MISAPFLETERALRARPELIDDLEVIDRAGSDRCFYRLNLRDHQPLVVMRYGRARAENNRYVPLSRFLENLGIPTPPIHAWDPEKRLVWMADQGRESLWSLRHLPWDKLREHYKNALRLTARLHRDGPALAALEKPPLEHPFTLALYRWEQDYFFENCLSRHFGLNAAELGELRLLPALAVIPARLTEARQSLVHRDLQSQNILVRDSEIIFIDFQGMRIGHPLYDLASLLFDPYMPIDRAQRDELAAFYAEQTGCSPDSLKDELALCAVQRLMQALGAYGFLAHVRGRGDFLQHIPTALDRLTELSQSVPGLGPLAKTLNLLPR